MAGGVDYVESRLTEDQSDLRVIAAVQIPNHDSSKPMVHV
jgi:hypothetical protein